jgi:hypothetical protein
MKRKVWIVPLLFFFAACSSSGCTSTATVQRGLDISLVALNQAAATFGSYDKERMRQLVKSCDLHDPNIPGQAKCANDKLDQYQLTVQQPFLAALLTAYGAIAVAALTQNDAAVNEQNIVAAGKAVLLVYQHLKALIPTKEKP